MIQRLCLLLWLVIMSFLGLMCYEGYKMQRDKKDMLSHIDRLGDTIDRLEKQIDFYKENTIVVLK